MKHRSDKHSNAHRSKRWRAFGILAVYIGIFGIAALSGYAEETVNIVTFEYPPIMTATLPNDGLLGEIVHTAFREAGVNAKIEYTSPKRVLMQHIGTAETAAFLAPVNLVKRQQAETKVSCVNPLVNILMVFYYYKPHHQGKELRYETLADLQPYSVAVITGSNTIPLLTEAGISIEESDVDAQIRKLQAGRTDLAALGLLTGKSVIARLFPEEINQFAFIEKPLMELPTSICFNTQHPDGQRMADLFARGFVVMQEQGTYRKLLEQYYAPNPIPDAYHTMFDALNRGIFLDMTARSDK